MSKRTIVCLCGSTRFSEAFRQANLQETLAGKIVLTIGCDMKSDDGLNLTEADKERLDELHLDKIALASEILVLNVGGYVGESTSREICFAHRNGKYVRTLAPITDHVFEIEAADQGTCDCCEVDAAWLRYDPVSGRVSGRCDRHAWVNKGGQA